MFDSYFRAFCYGFATAYFSALITFIILCAMKARHRPTPDVEAELKRIARAIIDDNQ